MAKWIRRLAYNVVLVTLSPVLLLWFFALRKGREQAWTHRADFFGLSKPVNTPCIWFHAVSVGEVLASIPLLKALQQQYPHYRLLVTTTTATGKARLLDAMGDSVEHRFAPLDLPGAAALFLKRHSPQALILMEREWWLNWLTACHRADVPVCVVNGRMSPDSFRFYQRFSSLSQDMLSLISASYVQEHADEQRLLTLGAQPEQVEVLGNIKFDLAIDTADDAVGRQLTDAIGARPVWLAASTHDDEEARLLACHQRLRLRHPELLLILVPRHPQRFPAVTELLRTSGEPFSQRSHHALPTKSDSVYLADTMGEMLRLLSVADVVFMGGSLVDVGGHNLLEPAALAKPSLIGPHYYNFQQITEQLVACDGCVVTDEAQLETDIDNWLTHPSQRNAVGQAAQQFVEKNQGALQRTLTALNSILN